VVNDLLGGELLVAQVRVAGVVDGVHYWNRLDGGVDVDLTRDQFTADEVVLEPTVGARRPLPGPERARAAYLLLRERVFSALAVATSESILRACAPRQ
jgi:hypothetical protein